MNKESYQKKIDKQLEEIELQINTLMSRPGQPEDEEFLTNIRIKQTNAKARLAELERATGEEEWQNSKIRLLEAMAKIKNALYIATMDSGR